MCQSIELVPFSLQAGVDRLMKQIGGFMVDVGSDDPRRSLIRAPSAGRRDDGSERSHYMDHSGPLHLIF